ncbi:MAG: argininosuccinate synthase [Nitrospirae bacterium CG18_big_fil_WC_8_21_14_2_50_70_55]|nr:argininosuccinate synthase [Deltaproteobacteria bacterium]OIP62474.1 MAG: argininosuccinate synthase [Nitrospirae bacterium CG2_30_70_394]PIQ07227.1 MAG: argininosuccinate synthase [Nitrospirae bacterium CG18_big_fil_WC_8_21_14_2_50_70_55]PIU79126.1 MAG: argininosuccinate synthase [Nitrospirae bacterium CG06_land_8_20_14_3_00_70_43]PIW82133.1 MAG: argininosuccinate synthase [Nitrospirae bacterium CG_4_8_14_3_um_filter_70_85]PIX83401.1 MAG: argininosuccinate synthase [Nitrospirae bacterium C
MAHPKKVVLAYSGGLDTSVIVSWLIETYGCAVVCFTADLGQGEDLSGVRQKALATGATEAFVEDLREEFVADFVQPMMRAGALYEGVYLLGTSIARPLIAKRLVEIARQTGADAIAHGATGKGNDQVRFELSAYALAPQIRIVAPWREWDLGAREQLVAYAKAHSIPVPVTPKKPWSSDGNLLHLSFEGGILEDPWAEPEAEMFERTVAPQAAPDAVTELTLTFDHGNPVAIDGAPLSPARLLARLNEIAGANGIGRVDLVENRYVGMKSRGVYETPGGTVWHTAHQAMQSLTVDREALHLLEDLMPRYARLVYNGYWFSPEREALQVLVDRVAERVSGEVRLKLYKGNVTVTGRRSPHSLYSQEVATFEEDTVYNQADAGGFIKLNALRLRLRAMGNDA